MEVSVLAGDVEQLAGLAAAGAEVAVVEQQHPDPGRAEALGVGGEAQLLGRVKPCAITISGRGPSKPSGRYSQPAHQSPPEWKVISLRIGFPSGFGAGPAVPRLDWELSQIAARRSAAGAFSGTIGLRGWTGETR
jgi:hypothetical protein